MTTSSCSLVPDDFLEKSTIIRKIGEGTYSDVHLYKYNGKEYIVKDFSKMYKEYHPDVLNSLITKEIDSLVKFSDLDCVSKVRGICTKTDENNNIRFLIVLDNLGITLTDYIEEEKLFLERLATAMEMIQVISPFIILSKKIHFNHYDVGLKNILINRHYSPLDTSLKEEITENIEVPQNPPTTSDLPRNPLVNSKFPELSQNSKFRRNSSETFNNILLSPESLKTVNQKITYTYSIIDFGVSEFSLKEFRKISPGSVYTLYWKPPEQYSNNYDIINLYRDQGDMWAFALVFLELIVGKRFNIPDGTNTVSLRNILSKLINYSVPNVDSSTKFNVDSSVVSDVDIDVDKATKLDNQLRKDELLNRVLNKEDISAFYTSDIRLDYERFILENCSTEELDLIPENFKTFFRLGLQFNPEKRLTVGQFQEIFNVASESLLKETSKLNLDEMNFNSYLLPKNLENRYLTETIVNMIMEIHLLLNLSSQCLIFSIEVAGRYFGMVNNDIDDFAIICCIYLAISYLELDNYRISFHFAEKYLLSKDVIKEASNLDYIELRQRNMLVKNYANSIVNHTSDILRSMSYYILNWKLIFILSEYGFGDNVETLIMELIRIPDLVKQLTLPVDQWKIFRKYVEPIELIGRGESTPGLSTSPMMVSLMSPTPLLDKIKQENGINNVDEVNNVDGVNTVDEVNTTMSRLSLIPVNLGPDTKVVGEMDDSGSIFSEIKEDINQEMEVDDSGSIFSDSRKITVNNIEDEELQISDEELKLREDKMKLEKDKTYKIKLEFYENGGSASVKLGWRLPGEDPFASAVDAAIVNPKKRKKIEK